MTGKSSCVFNQHRFPVARGALRLSTTHQAARCRGDHECAKKNKGEVHGLLSETWRIARKLPADFYVADLLHAAFAGLLFFKQLFLAADVAAIAFGEHVLAQRLDVFTCNHIGTDRRLQPPRRTSGAESSRAFSTPVHVRDRRWWHVNNQRTAASTFSLLTRMSS